MTEHVQSQSENPEPDNSKAWPKVAIIVLNWNGWQDALDCFESLQHLSYPNYQVILVDNSSMNDSVERIKEWCEGKIAVNTNFVKFSPELKPVKLVV